MKGKRLAIFFDDMVPLFHDSDPDSCPGPAARNQERGKESNRWGRPGSSRCSKDVSGGGGFPQGGHQGAMDANPKFLSEKHAYPCRTMLIVSPTGLCCRR
jgi:hypothetical protein